MAAQGSVLDCSKHCHPKCRRAWKVYGLLALLLAAVLLAASLPSSVCLLDTEPEPGLGTGTGNVPGLEGLARLQEVQQRLQEVQQQLQARVAALEQGLAAANRTRSTGGDVPNRTLAEMHRQWDGWRSQLDAVQGVIVQLRQQLSQLQQHRETKEAVITQLQEDTRALQEEVARQKEQLQEAWIDRGHFQDQIQRLSSKVWYLQRHHSSASTAMLSGAATALSLLVTLLTAQWLH